MRRTLALNLLENETLALAEIAFSLGYSDVSAFNHAFRRLGRPLAGRLSSTMGWFISNPPQLRSRSRPLGDRFE